MATVMQTAETRTVTGGTSTFVVNWWKTTHADISLVSTVSGGTAKSVTNWSKSTAVNGPFFPNAGNHTIVNAFAVNNGAAVLSTGPDTDGSKNYENIDYLTNPLDYLMDPMSKTGPHDVEVLFGNKGTFPVTSVKGQSYNMNNIRWALGGMSLETNNASYDTASTFNSNWKWRNIMSTSALSKRTAIGYTGSTGAAVNYVVAVFGECKMFDVRKFMKDKGCTAYALYLDGSDSTQAKNNGTIVVTSSRTIPVIIAM